MLYELFPLTSRNGPECRVGVVNVKLSCRCWQAQRDWTTTAIQHGSRKIGGYGDLGGRSESDYSGRSSGQRLNYCSDIGRHDPIYSDHADRYRRLLVMNRTKTDLNREGVVGEMNHIDVLQIGRRDQTIGLNACTLHKLNDSIHLLSRELQRSHTNNRIGDQSQRRRSRNGVGVVILGQSRAQSDQADSRDED